MKRTLICALLSLAGTAASAQVPSLPQQLGADARATIERIIDSARTAGLPATPLVDKVAEGVLKGADDQRIIIAVRGLSRELAEARDILGSASDGTLLGATASALHAGASAQELQRLAKPENGETPDPHALAAGFVTLVDLVAKHIPPTAATSAVGDLLRRRASDIDFATLRGEVDRDIRAGTAPDVALGNRMRKHMQTLEDNPLDRRVKRPPPV